MMTRFIISDHAQGTDQWRVDRAGKATGSRAKDILAMIKSGGEAAARRDYRLELAIERATGQAAEQGFISKEMQWGTDNEPFARMADEEINGRLISESGFVYLPDVMAGCSVDGFIDENGRMGIWESKCPKSFTHISYMRAGIMPPDYVPQITHNMWITGAEFADFVSFDPRMPGKLKYFTVRIERDDAVIFDYERKVLAFLREVDEEYAALMEMAE